VVEQPSDRRQPKHQARDHHDRGARVRRRSLASAGGDGQSIQQQCRQYDLRKPDEACVLQYQNIGSLVTRGVEAEFKSEIFSSLEVAGNYTYVRAENTLLGVSYSAPMVSRHAANFTISRDLYYHLRLSVLGE
jgi:outer membrane receptor for ferrienterochelin and colicin